MTCTPSLGSRWALRLIVLMLWPLVPALAGGVDDGGEMVMILGDTRALDLRRGETDFVYDDNVLGTQLVAEGRKLVLLAKKAGVSTLMLVGNRERTYRVRVFAREPTQVERSVQLFLKNMSGVELRRLDDGFILDGEVSSESALERVGDIVELFPGQVRSLVRLNEESAIDRPMIAIEFELVEVREAEGLEVGFLPPTKLDVSASASFKRTLAGSSDVGAADYLHLSGGTGGFGARLSLLARDDGVRLRNRSTLVTQSGHEAHYTFGGRWYVPLEGGFGGARLEKVDYGTLLKVRPRIDAAGLIHLSIDATVSELDTARRIEVALPSFLLSEVQTLVALREGESVVLSGLDAHRQVEAEEGLWPLSEIPIIGWLVKSHAGSTEKRRTLILITPRLYRPGDAVDARLRGSIIDEVDRRIEDEGDDDF